jgi:hypothetical protein
MFNSGLVAGNTLNVQNSIIANYTAETCSVTAGLASQAAT